MKISLVTPTFNSEKSIRKCVETVINQTYHNYEHIIVDNLSSDNTVEIIKKLYSDNNLISNLQIISDKDSGIAEAFNKGIKASVGDVIGILASDDYYFNSRVFESVVSAFAQKKINFVHGDILFIDESFGSNQRRPLLCDIREAMPYNHPTMFFKRSVYNEVGLYDESFRFAMDYDFVCRMIRFYRNLDSISFYIKSNPIIVMNAGGVSWRNEKKTLDETVKAQKKNNLWNLGSLYYYLIRLLRINLKELFSKAGLNFIVKLWRKVKWK